MIFFILTKDKFAITRPDSTRNKDNGDYFIPTDVNTVGFTPVVYVRMVRTGKMIGMEFTERYYDAIGFGILLYPSPHSDDGHTEYDLAISACFDKTSLLPLPMYNPVTLEQEGNIFSISKDSNEIFSCNTVGKRSAIADAIVNCSLHSTIHKGDLVLAELDSIRTLCTRNEAEMNLHATFCENESIDVDLKF